MYGGILGVGRPLSSQPTRGKTLPQIIYNESSSSDYLVQDLGGAGVEGAY